MTHRCFSKRGKAAIAVTVVSVLVATVLHFAFGNAAGVASGAGLSRPVAQVTPTTVTGLYRNTTEGFSLQLPNGWQGETGDKPLVLSAQNNQTSPTVFVHVFVFRSSQPEDPDDWLVTELAAYAPDSPANAGAALADPEGGTASQRFIDYNNTSGVPVREIWSAYARGTQMVMVRAIMAQSTYASSVAILNQMFNSFTFEVPAPFGASQSDSLFLSSGNIRTIDPALWRGSAEGIVGALFGGLVKLNHDLEVEGELASDWEVDSTGTIYTFHIHPQAKFHDGRQVTAEDVKYSWERAASPGLESPTVRTYLGDIVGVKEMIDGQATEISGLEIVDSLTVRVTIDAPKSYFLQKLTYPTSYIVDRDAVQAGGADWTMAPNGSGRYSLKVWDEDDLLILERVEGHHLGTPGLKHVVYRLFAGITMSMYEAGEIDMAGVGGNNIERVLDPQNPLSQDVVEGVGMCTTYLYFNVDKGPFDDIDVRRAFAMSMDIDRYIDVALKGYSTKASSILPPGMPGHTPGLFDVEYDPAAARALLESTEHFSSGLLSEPIESYSGSSAFLWMWNKNLGVEFISISLPEPDDWFNRRDNGEFPFGFTGWCADYPDPQNFLEVLMHGESDENYSGYSNPEVNALLDQAATEPDEETRLDLYLQAEQMILDDWVFIPISHSLSFELVKPYVKNYEWTPIGIQQFHEMEIQR